MAKRYALAQLIAANVRAVIGKDATEADVCKATGLGSGSANRITSPAGQNVRLNTLQQIAAGYHMEAWELLMPDFNPELRPRQRLNALQEEVEILRQQLTDIRAALKNDTASNPGSPRRDHRGTQSDRLRDDPSDRKNEGYESKGN